MAKPGRPRFDDVLTPTEWKVCEAVRHGLSNPQIAGHMGVSRDAIKYHVTNVLQKLGFQSRKQLQAWNGIRRSSALFEGARQMDEHVELGTLGQISRTVGDIKAAEDWYRDCLGLRHLYSFGKLSFFDCDGVRLFLSEGDPQASQSILYFKVADIHAAHGALQARGVEFINAPHLIHTHEDGTEEWMAFFKDHQGLPLALMSQASIKGAEELPV